MGILDGLFDIGKTLTGFIPGVGPAISAGIGGVQDMYDSATATNAAAEATAHEEGRQDTAVQRRVADLRAAGLAPQLAAGGSAASSAPIMASQERDPGEGNAAAAAAQAMTLMKQKEDVSRSSAETAKLNAESESAKRENDALDNTYIQDQAGSYTLRQRKQLAVIDELKSRDMKNRSWAQMDSMRAEMIAAGIPGEVADSLIEKQKQREAALSEPYFQPSISPGSFGGAALDLTKGAVGPATRGLIPGE
jgi:hypothetical protein